MKKTITKLAAPLLSYFEQGDENFTYKASHRKILVAVGVLFLLISFGSLVVTLKTGQYGGLFPLLVFLAVGIVCEVVGLLGSDKAVANIWKNK